MKKTRMIRNRPILELRAIDGSLILPKIVFNAIVFMFSLFMSLSSG